jgi:hypothetical protein
MNHEEHETREDKKNQFKSPFVSLVTFVVD